MTTHPPGLVHALQLKKLNDDAPYKPREVIGYVLSGNVLYNMTRTFKTLLEVFPSWIPGLFTKTS
jgi:hypothetical protein